MIRSRSLDSEVRDADRPDALLALQLDQCLPCLDGQALLRDRPVDQVQVDVVATELVEALLERSRHLVAPVVAVAQLGGDEQVAAFELAREHARRGHPPRCRRRRPCRSTGSRSASAVSDRLRRLILGDLEDPEAQLGHVIAVVQVQVWDQCRLRCHTERLPCSPSLESHCFRCRSLTAWTRSIAPWSTWICSPRRCGRTPSDLSAFVESLAAKLEEAVPGRVRVDRRAVRDVRAQRRSGGRGRLGRPASRASGRGRRRSRRAARGCQEGSS